MEPGLAAAARGSPRWLVIIEGVILIALGVAAVVFPIFASLFAAVLLGWILLVSGIVGLIGAFAHRPHVHLGWSIVSAALAIVAGVFIAFFPLTGVITLVIVLAAWLFLDGVSSVMIGLDQRRSGSRSWGWWLASAVVDWILAGALLFLNPIGDIVVVGIIVGVDLFFGGLALLIIGARPAAAG
ncbi:MAG TPA: DUF308 domain-containing protein [Caulobacteraceae bacterium]|nr:DUF308 domain-containing protein [Caulobacteraceae bacterium]